MISCSHRTPPLHLWSIYLVPFLVYRYCVLPSVFATLWVHLVHCLRVRSCYFCICLLVCLPIDVSLSSCFPDVSHFFLASFLALIASFTSSIHHYVTLSPVGLLPTDIPSTSGPAINITKPVFSHNSWTLSNSLLSPNCFSLNCVLRLSSFSLHNLIFGVTCPDLLRAVGWTAAVLVLL